MTLLSTIQQDLLSCRKEGTNKKKISLLTTLYSESANVGLNDKKRESTNSEVITVIKKFIKSLDECIEAGKKQSKDISSYLEEKEILEKYLPAQLTEEQLKDCIEVFITGNGSTSKADIMKYLKSAFSGKYDGRMASSVVDAMLSHENYEQI